LQRRHVYIDFVRYIGKESNHLEDVDAGLIHSEDSVYTEYCDKRRDEWTAVASAQEGAGQRAYEEVRHRPECVI